MTPESLKPEVCTIKEFTILESGEKETIELCQHYVQITSGGIPVIDYSIVGASIYQPQNNKNNNS